MALPFSWHRFVKPRLRYKLELTEVNRANVEQPCTLSMLVLYKYFEVRIESLSNSHGSQLIVSLWQYLHPVCNYFGSTRYDPNLLVSTPRMKGTICLGNHTVHHTNLLPYTSSPNWPTIKSQIACVPNLARIIMPPHRQAS